MENKKIESWRLIVGVISILCIIVMYVRKNLIHIDVTISLPLVITSIAVILLKVTAIVIVVLFVKWFTNKIKK